MSLSEQYDKLLKETTETLNKCLNNTKETSIMLEKIGKQIDEVMERMRDERK